MNANTITDETNSHQVGHHYVIPERADNYDGTFWKYQWKKTKSGERVRWSESDPTITEKIQLNSAAPFCMESPLRSPDPADFESDAEPTGVRYFIEDGEYFRSLNGADVLPAKTLLIRLRYVDSDGDVSEGTKIWLTRVGLYVLAEQMQKRKWRVIEVIPVSYERQQPTEQDERNFLAVMFGKESSEVMRDIVVRAGKTIRICANARCQKGPGRLRARAEGRSRYCSRACRNKKSAREGYSRAVTGL